MTVDKTTRRVYSADELHRLRATCSQPKLREAIEEHEGEDAELVKAIMNNDLLSPGFDVHRDWIEKIIHTPTPHKSHKPPSPTSPTAHESPTEHVLRGSKSFAAQSYRCRTSGNSLRVPSNKENRSTTDNENSRQSSGQNAPSKGLVLGELAPNSQILRPGTLKLGPSPTPSLKKKKAEAIVKAHGSPQHVRVTAGGRIVPSEQSPLCQPRYGYSAIKTNGGLIKFAPNHPIGKAQWTQATENGYVAQDVNGRLCQIVNGTILPLNEVDGALRLYVEAPNLKITSRFSSFAPGGQEQVEANGNQQRTPSQGKRVSPPDPSLYAQTNALELEYSKLEHELKELDKTEVLHGRTMGKAAKEALVSKRRELVVTLDNIRKAIKSIKSMPPPDAPTSPRAMNNNNNQSISPPRNRLPAFLQQRMHQGNDAAAPPMPPAYGPYFGMAQAPQFNGQYGFQPTPSPDAAFGPQAFGMPVPPMFVPPPPFDGSMAPPFQPYQDPQGVNILSTQPAQANAAVTGEPPNPHAPLPQTDGAASFADLRKATSPRPSHALDIKAPEPKPTAALKSNLNPMSPAYKPGNGVLQPSQNVDRPSVKSVKDRVPTPLSPLHQLRPVAAGSKPGNATDDTSPTKKSSHLQSSSVSSFETADFFPRNTREYSTRKYAYPESTGQSEDKENVSPVQSSNDVDSSPANITVTKSSNKHEAPTAPPGTPVSNDVSNLRPELPIRVDDTSFAPNIADHAPTAVPDRQAHNLSPKVKRQDFLFVHEDPSQYMSQPSSSPDKFKTCIEDLPTTSTPVESLDFSEASTEWIEGYRAGLARKPVASDRVGDFLDGYCAGLLKSKPSKIGPSTGSPIKSSSRRPSPGVVQSRSSSRLQQLDRREPAAARPPFESQVQSMDTLKEAVLAPRNENAILSPAADGPHVSDTPFNLGAWAKNQKFATSSDALANADGDGLAGYPFPHRTASMLRRQGIGSESDTVQKFGPGSISSGFSANPMPSTLASSLAEDEGSAKSGNRVTSMTSIDSNLYRQWPGHRVFSNQLEWKSASSVAQAAGLASGFLANVQFDGSQRPASIAGEPVMRTHSRFKEGSLDGVTNPPNSPQTLEGQASDRMSSTASPNVSPSKFKKDSPNKGSSPAKAKFENLAEKVGIKVKKDGSPNSPTGKRGGWRDVWRSGARKETSKDESSSFLPYA